MDHRAGIHSTLNKTTSANNKLFWFWVACLIIGQTSSLRLIRAGNLMAYQHYRSLQQLLDWPWLLYSLILIMQFAVVSVGLYSNRKKILNWMHQHLKIWQIAILVGVVILSSAAVSEDVFYYLNEIWIASLIEFFHLGNVILIVITIPAIYLSRLEPIYARVFGSSAKQEPENPWGMDSYAWLAALWVVLLSAGLSFFVYQNHPHIPDEVAYLMQARFLAEGQFVMPAPQVPEAFEFYLMQVVGNQWFPVPPVGWPAMLAVGEFLGVPWLVNPILNGINILLIYLVLKGLYSRNLSRVAILMLCCSPWFIFMGMNFMTHTFTLTCALVGVWGVMLSRGTGKATWALVAGMAIGLVSLIRPLEGLLLAVLLGLWSIGMAGKRLRGWAIVGLIAGTMIVGGIVLPYNQVLAGSATEFPINQYLDQRYGEGANSYGFGSTRGMNWPLDPNPGHSPLDGLINANLNSFSLNIELFGWGMGSLLLAAYWLVSGRYQKSDYLMVAVILTVFGVFFFYYFSGGPDFGARYWYFMLMPLVVLSVRGMQVLASQEKDETLPNGYRHTRLLTAVIILSGVALLVYFPWRVMDKYLNYLNMRPDIRELAAEFQFGRSLVLVRGNNHPDYASAAVHNPLDLTSDDTIYAWDKNESVSRAVVQTYSDRQIWIIEGPSLAEGEYHVIAGPLSFQEFLQQGAVTP